jgi:hypothetical protein
MEYIFSETAAQTDKLGHADCQAMSEAPSSMAGRRYGDDDKLISDDFGDGRRNPMLVTLRPVSVFNEPAIGARYQE